jgi:hypothetical protein
MTRKVAMAERRKKKERRRREKRRLLTEAEFRRLIETGKARPGDRRAWNERRGKKRRKKQIGI